MVQAPGLNQLCHHHDFQLIQSHVAPSHGPPVTVLSLLFFLAKSLLLPKPRGKKKHSTTTWSSLLSFRTVWSSLFFSRTAWFSPFPSEPHGPPRSMAATPRFKSQCPSSFAAPFPTPLTVSYTCQHSLFFHLYWAAIVSLGRCGPLAWSQSSPSSHTGAETRGNCFPVTSWVEVTPIPLAQSMATAT